jgi:hypothetical protein
MTTDYEETYAKNWQHLVETPDGTLNRDQVMRELHDFTTVMHCASMVFEELAGFSKPNTDPKYVIEYAERQYNERYADYLCERAYELVADGTDTGGAAGEAMKALAEEWHEGAWDAYIDGRRRVAEMVKR